VETRGSVYSAGPMAPLDYQEPHLRTRLAFMGIKDMTFIRAQGLGIGPGARAKGLATARTEMAAA